MITLPLAAAVWELRSGDTTLPAEDGVFRKYMSEEERAA